MEYMETVEVRKAFNLVPELLDVPYSRIWTVYDKKADVLYLNFKKPSHADDSELTDDDRIIRYEKGMSWGSPCSMQARGGRGMIKCIWFELIHSFKSPSMNCDTRKTLKIRDP